MASMVKIVPSRVEIVQGPHNVKRLLVHVSGDVRLDTQGLTV